MAAVLSDAQGTRRCSEWPDSVPARWILQTPPGRTQLIAPHALRRDPVAEAEGLSWALAARSRAPGESLWLEHANPLTLRAAPALGLMAAMDHAWRLDREHERGEVEERLIRMSARAAGVAHDLRNQLSLARLCGRKLGATGGEEDARELDAALGEAVDLCQTFLTGAQSSHRQARPLRDLLGDEAKAAARISGRAGEVRVVAKCLTELPPLEDDRPLARALRNLLLNAIAASPPGGRVSVHARPWHGEGLELSVEDEGRGMSRAELERLVGVGSSRGGTGFGTTSILACAEELGAQLRIESEPQVGTRVKLRLEGARRTNRAPGE